MIKIKPRYLVYPRYFRDNLSYQTKRKYLEQANVSPNNDTYFYDTGFLGSIPEEIMRVMDFPPEEIDQRIKMFYVENRSPQRRIKKLNENIPKYMVEGVLENHPQTEESAKGVFIDDKGTLHHMASPSDPEDQFYSLILREAVVRHYWLKEKLHN